MLPDRVPVLEHGLVRLRPWLERDATLVVSVASDPVLPSITSIPNDPSPLNVGAYLERQHRRLSEGGGYSFVIAEAATDEGIGQITLGTSEIASGRASAGYWVAQDFRRKGFGTAALRALTTWALRLPEVERLELHIEPLNEASWRAAETVGYQREGLLRSWLPVGDTRKDVFIYSILPPR